MTLFVCAFAQMHKWVLGCPPLSSALVPIVQVHYARVPASEVSAKFCFRISDSEEVAVDDPEDHFIAVSRPVWEVQPQQYLSAARCRLCFFSGLLHRSYLLNELSAQPIVFCH